MRDGPEAHEESILFDFQNLPSVLQIFSINSGDHIAESHKGAMRYSTSALIHALATFAPFAQAWYW
jgi:hypothetical protein